MISRYAFVLAVVVLGGIRLNTVFNDSRVAGMDPKALAEEVVHTGLTPDMFRHADGTMRALYVRGTHTVLCEMTGTVPVTCNDFATYP